MKGILAAAGAVAIGTTLFMSAPASATTALTHKVPHHASVLVVGDSWASGNYIGASRTFIQDAANTMGWTTHVYAVSGSGYLSSSHSYLTQAQGAPSSLKPDVILVQGGSNDWHKNLGLLGPAATNTYSVLKHRFPNAVIIIIGPGMDLNPLPATYTQIDSILAQTAHSTGNIYQSILPWITAKNMDAVISPTNHHPTVSGSVYLGNLLVNTLKTYTHY